MTCEEVKQRNLDVLTEDFQDWQHAFCSLINDNMNIHGNLKDLQKDLLKEKEISQQLRNGCRQFQEQIDKLHDVLKTRCDLQGENHDLKLELEKMREENTKERYDHEVKFGQLKDEIETVKVQQKQEMEDLEDSHCAQAAADKATYERGIEDKMKEIKRLEERIAEIEKEIHSEKVKLRLEYDAKLLKLQKQTNRVQQSAAASSNQEIFRKKLQHAKSEYEREMSGLKRTISDLENQLSSRSSAGKSGLPLSKKKRF